MDALYDVYHYFARYARQNIAVNILQSYFDGSGSFTNDFIQVTATVLGVITPAFVIFIWIRYIFLQFNKQQEEKLSQKEEKQVTQQIETRDHQAFTKQRKKRNVINLERHELRNFDDETELKSFYTWRDSYPLNDTLDWGDSDEDNEQSDVNTTNHTEPFSAVQNDGTVDPTFDKYYKEHTYLPPFVQNREAIEKYTETMLAVLDSQKEGLDINYNEDTITFRKIRRLIDNDLVPFDVSPEKVTSLVTGNRRLSDEEMLDILCTIYDLCISNKVAEWSLHFRKTVQPYFRNRHYRKQFQTRPVNDLLQDIQTYYSPPEQQQMTIPNHQL